MNQILPSSKGIDTVDELKKTYEYSIVAGVLIVAASAALAAIGL
jgi:hypothetical protein